MRTLLGLLLLCPAGSLHSGEHRPEPSVAPLTLSVRLAGTRDAVLEWRGGAGDAAGHIVEYINRPGDEWVILGFLPAARRMFTHPRLAPGTPYSYRVRPFFGPTSASIAVTVAEGLSDRAYAEAYARPEDYSWAPPQKLVRPGAGVLAQKSARLTAAAAPADFKAEIMKTTVSGFRLTWTDRANDEEGFLLERLDAGGDFTVCAVIDPDMNSFGWALEPPARTGSFRLRAYYYGAASNVAGIVTPDEPGEPPRAAAMKPGT